MLYNRPFEALHWDLTHFDQSLARTRYFSHSVDPVTRYHLGEDLSDKKQSSESLLSQVIAEIPRPSYEHQPECDAELVFRSPPYLSSAFPLYYLTTLSSIFDHSGSGEFRRYPPCSHSKLKSSGLSFVWFSVFSLMGSLASGVSERSHLGGTFREKDGFGMVGMQTDDTLILGTKTFVAKEEEEIQRAKFRTKQTVTLSPETSFEFNGCRLSQEGKYIHLRQKVKERRSSLSI
ncbi:uncharacterized protein N7515_004730 [Penicillium bovifimosum]|uniref:Uncharacterized protein n=1 Tax=Penicillium bovifimosum TaxID=126998 RepID=A0A9W9L463_9EURO|nr:uncharacterized protein N7515_004730 [Penicillium bovifimosum]KAJ5135452.1 hypothetical protein N7515_004730 [Penicillium bovifimosum]